MLDVLKERLVDGLTIKSVKETTAKYSICFEYEGDETVVALPKSCAPGCSGEVADHSVITAMSAIFMNRGDYTKAKEWLDKLAKG